MRLVQRNKFWDSATIWRPKWSELSAWSQIPACAKWSIFFSKSTVFTKYGGRQFLLRNLEESVSLKNSIETNLSRVTGCDWYIFLILKKFLFWHSVHFGIGLFNYCMHFFFFIIEQLMYMYYSIVIVHTDVIWTKYFLY